MDCGPRRRWGAQTARKAREMDALITPERVVEDRMQRLGLSREDLAVAPTVVLSWRLEVIESLAQAAGAALQPAWSRSDHFRFYTGQVGDRPVSFGNLPIGAPQTVMMMEEMIACGAATFVGLGWAGSLQQHLRIGSLIVPTSCLREEGTSCHYVEDEQAIVADPALAAGLVRAGQALDLPVHSGRLWTTDAPYRELRSKALAYRRQGVLGVDMETSAMYALGVFRGVRACNLLVVSDELGADWDHAFGSQRLIDATRVAERVVLRCLSERG